MLVRAKKATDAAEEIFHIKCCMADLLKCGIEIVKEKVKLMYSKCVRVCVYLPIRVAKQSQLADQNQNPASEKGMMTAECRGCCHSALQYCKLQSGCERWWHACPVPVWQFTSVACLQPPKLSARYFCKYLPLCGTYSFAPRQVKCVGFHGW